VPHKNLSLTLFLIFGEMDYIAIYIGIPKFPEIQKKGE
jgi:hypothetical protein